MNLTLEENRMIYELLLPLCWTTKRRRERETERLTALLTKRPTEQPVELSREEMKALGRQRRMMVKVMEKLDEEFYDESNRPAFF